MSSVHPSTSVCIFGPVYSAQTLNTDNDFIGDMQLVVAISSVMPLGVGHVALGCSPPGPGTTPSSGIGSAFDGSISSLLLTSSPPSTDDVSRFLLLKTTTSTWDCSGVTSNYTAHADFPVALLFTLLIFSAKLYKSRHDSSPNTDKV